MRQFGRMLFVLCAVSAGAVQVENFTLLDHEGNAHELYYYGDATAIVVMVHGNSCPIVRNVLPDFKSLRDRYSPQGVQFFMLNSNLQDHRATILEEALEWGIDVPILDDTTQLIGEGLMLTRTAEVLVIDPQDWELEYRGPINDRVAYERQKESASQNYVADALDAIRDGQGVEVTSLAAKGCLINFPNGDSQPEISYVDDVAPILQANCTACHVDGGIGSWAMNSYEMVRGFSPMIREVIRTKRMPPWHADPHIGTWSNDRSLSDIEKQTLVHWIEAGSPRGEGPDPLLTVSELPTEWRNGEPDIVVNVPAFDVPATGVVEYQYHTIPVDVPEDVWIRAYDVLPGDTNVVHHLLMGTTPAGSGGRSVTQNFIGGYAPGGEFAELPHDTGILFKQGSAVVVQMHYTPYGKEVTDETKVGIYLHDAVPEKILRQGVVIDTTIEIPPHEKAHEEKSYIEFPRDATLYSVLPHSHYRGSASEFRLIHADGGEEVLLSVPNYDFNWQTGYDFAEPIKVTAGTKLVHRTIYDNSNMNPGNPDPAKTVTWGLQSWDEMLYGAFAFTWDVETTTEPITNNASWRIAQTFGVLDEDIDGLIEQSDLKPSSSKRLAMAFQVGDKDGDGALNIDEYRQYVAWATERAAKMREERRAQRSAEASETVTQ